MAQERTDEELLAAYQQGDPEAFESLLPRYRAPLFTFLLRMLGDREKAEDLAQETFLRIVTGASDWEHRARFQTWLFTIARNLCVDHPPRSSLLLALAYGELDAARATEVQHHLPTCRESRKQKGACE